MTDKIIGIGECGIDLHYANYNLQRQKDVFKAQIELALKYDLALSIHSRDAAEETFKIIDQYSQENNFKGIMHCYSYDQGYADEAIKHKLMLGIGGTLTYPKNEILRTIVKNIDLHHIALETDAPFLSPQILRGKENCPANIKIIAEFIANLRQTSYENVAKTTTESVKKLFKID
jgi:TatD DNase family protein